VLGHNAGCDPHKFYDSIRYHPDYPINFSKRKNGTKRVSIKNNSILAELNKMGRDWKKVYQDGYIGHRQVSLHYFQDKSGVIYDFKIKWDHWSNGY